VRVYPELLVDEEFTELGDLGYTGTLNDRQYGFLRGLGFLGSLADMMAEAGFTNAGFQIVLDGVIYERLQDDTTGEFLFDDTTNQPLYDRIT